MDPVTHGLIGASASQSVVSKEQLRPAAIIGMLSAMLADLDVFISDSSDPLLNIEIHRQFSHSFVFIPIGALIAAGLLWYFYRQNMSFKKIYVLSFLGYATAGIADTFTSYGTKLFWPFLDTRFSWDLISVFDPLFSVVILGLIIWTLYKKNPKISWFTWVWIPIYLSMALIQQQRGKTVAKAIAEQENHQIEQIIVKPTLGNQLLWSIRYIAHDTLFASGVRLGLDTKVYPGESAPLLDWQQQYSRYHGTTLYNDINRFDKLSEGYLIRHPEKKNVIGDGRYAMLPTAMSPLWGIKIDTSHPDRHLLFETFREPTPKVRNAYIDMLLGNNP
ncbi:metal-dependent hydrolase [Fodinibius sp. SL11]|uniref:metal-dependent hydrolase n=1 Tax=Fodinibius sp. SL11 TaxID=3425690 RepID=UPI003F884879